jgi:hypothetical protein
MPEEPVDTALYFPNIRVPRDPWFTQVLLYWERAAAIVPAELAASPDRLGPYMRQLNGLQLVDFVLPDATLNYQMSNHIASRFVENVERAKAPSEERRSYVDLHIDKMSMDLFVELRDRGLAKKGPSWNWWKIEKRTANAYMAYLVSRVVETFTFDFAE